MKRFPLFSFAVLAGAVMATAEVTPAAAKDCESYGTSVEFVSSPAEAARYAKEEEKLVFILHVSGLFENSDFTWNNAEALRVNALADPAVGKFINQHFVSAFQKVGTFQIVGQQKQGGNVASYFCAPDGRVLHVIPGPVNSQTLLSEAQWVIDTVQASLAEYEKSGKSFKGSMREAHAERLRTQHGLTVEPVEFDTPAPGEESALSYRDPTGKPLAPVLPPPPIEGPDVSLSADEEAAFNARQDVARKAAAPANLVLDCRGRCWVLSNQGRADMLLAAHAMKNIETLYGSVFEGILGERVSTKPVVIANLFPWVR